MARTLGMLLAWIAGSAAAISVAWAGVSVVDRQAIDPGTPAASDVASVDSYASGATVSDPAAAPEATTPSADRSAADLDSSTASIDRGADEAVGSAGAAPADPDVASADRAVTSTTPESASSAPRASTTASSRPTTTATTNRTASSTSRPTTTSTTRAPTVSTTRTTAAPTTTAPPTTAPPTTQPAGQTLTFNLIGGSTAISFAPSGVSVLWATPNPGFTVSIEPESPGLKVEFRSEDHRSRVDAWWSGGPQHEIREEPRD